MRLRLMPDWFEVGERDPAPSWERVAPLVDETIVPCAEFISDLVSGSNYSCATSI